MSETPQPQASILWCGAPELEAVAGLPVVACTEAELPAARGLVTVLDARAFSSLTALSEAREHITGSALWLVDTADVEWLLATLPEQDDCALLTSPRALIAHRLRRLLGLTVNAHDGLTGLLSRVAFQEMAEAHLHHGTASLLFIDIDHFKLINDHFGHRAGDAVLQRLGGVLARHCAPSPVGRFGGEEFVVLLSGANEAQALELGEAIRQAVERCIWPEETELTVTVSVGVETTHENGATLVSMLERANAALYAAKAAGRNKVMHIRELESKAAATDTAVELLNFEHLTQVLTERFSGLLTWRSTKLFEAAREQAETDGVTGLPTRRSFDRRFSIACDHARRETEELCVALIDIDHFGTFNKEHGWPTGDKLLSHVVTTLRAALPPPAWLARYGGDELVLTLPRFPLPDARALAERLRISVDEAGIESTRGTTLSVSISIGIASFDARDPTPDLLLERASDHLLEAKNNGRHQVSG